METTKEKHATFTPGPWEVYSCEEGEGHGGILAPDGKRVCDLPKSKLIQPEDKRKNHYFVHSAEDEANARLIAAAPEMLEVLQEILAPCPVKGYQGKYDRRRTYNARKKAREVLAKVEGGEG